MSTPFLAALIAVAIGGACSAVQAPINSQLSSHIGDPMAAAAASFIIGALVLSALVLARGAAPAASLVAGVPWWAWTGGLFGAVFVLSTLWSVGTLGVVTLVAALVFGQLAAALLIDAIGAFGVPIREISLTRIAAVTLVAGGLVLSRS